MILAKRINPIGVRLPLPSKPLFAAMAQAGADSMGGFKATSDIMFRSYEDAKDNWESIARSMYGALALAAGAKSETVVDPGDAE